MPALPLHPFAELFPEMPGDEYATFRDDVAAHGLREPVWAWRGRLIDGRHRQRACDELGIECPRREYEGDEGGLAAFVVSLNMRRRHLTTGQRALIASEFANLERGDNQHTEVPQIWGTSPVSQAQAAELMNVSVNSVTSAAKVKRIAEPEVVEAVRAGAVSVSAAAAVADKAPEEQRAFVRARAEPRVQRDRGFQMTDERGVVLAWLRKRREGWPAEVQTSFCKMVRGVLKEMEGDDASD